MTYVDIAYGLAVLTAALIIWLAVKNERVRNALLIILGVLTAGYLGRAFWREDENEPKPTTYQPPPDTTVDELDDSLDFEVIDEQPDSLDSDDYPDDDPATVEQLSEWADDV